MHIKSQYPDVTPPPEINVHHAILRRPDQAEWPNYTLHIDAKTGKTRGFRDFIDRIQFAATALGAPTAEGGLGLSTENGDIIGIISENCMVSETILGVPFASSTKLLPGLHHFCSCVLVHNNPFCSHLISFQAI